jgi:hypothetical protein
MGIQKALSDLNLEIIRLDTVRNMKLPPREKHPATTREISFSYTYTEKTSEPKKKTSKKRISKKKISKKKSNPG